MADTEEHHVALGLECPAEAGDGGNRSDCVQIGAAGLDPHGGKLGRRTDPDLTIGMFDAGAVAAEGVRSQAEALAAEVEVHRRRGLVG